MKCALMLFTTFSAADKEASVPSWLATYNIVWTNP